MNTSNIEDCKDKKITVKDLYLKLLALEVGLDQSKKDVHCDIKILTRHFDRWLVIMAILNGILILSDFLYRWLPIMRSL